MAVRSPRILLRPNSSDEAVEILVEFYTDAKGNLREYLFDLESLTPAQRADIGKRIDGLITNLEFGSRRWVQNSIPPIYRDGADFAVRRMIAQNYAVRVSSGFDASHTDALNQLGANVYESMFTALENLRNRTKRTIAELNGIDVQDKLFKGITEGETRQRLSKVIQNETQNRGLTMFVDRGGKRWDIDRYADMVARTARADVFNHGVANRALENGFDLVQITRNGSQHEECRIWEGKVISLTGTTKGYPTLEEAKESGIFHPNCKHTYTPITPDEAVNIT